MIETRHRDRVSSACELQLGSCWIFHQKAWALKADSCSSFINNSWLLHNCIDKTKSLNEEQTPVISTCEFKRLNTDHMSWVRCRLNNHCYEKQVWREQYISWPLFKLKHGGNQIVSVPFDFHCISCQGEPMGMGTETVWLQTFFKISSIMIHRRKKVIQIWNIHYGEYMITELSFLSGQIIVFAAQIIVQMRPFNHCATESQWLAGCE